MTTTATPGGTAPRRVQVGLLLQRQGALIALVILVVFGMLRYGENFATGYNLSSFTGDTAKYGLVALGMTFVIMTGGIDLSVGSVVALGGVVAIMVSEHGLLPGLLAGIGAGAAVGVLNGFLITKLKLPPFISTLATLLAIRGLALTLADTRAAVAAPGGFQRLADWSLLGLPVAAWAMVLAFLVGAAVLNYTAWGRQVLAIGGNVDAAKLMGLPVARTTFSVYVLSGALAGCAGVFLGSQNGSVDTAAGQGWELTAIAAVVVGGTLLTGGVGSVLSTLVGVLLLQLIFNLIVFENGRGVINISSFWESVIRGAFLLVVVLLQVRLVRRRSATGRPA
ncbi:MAG TPA: ABC transporter permease [Actinophytocola sp.]|nr:ABC transporter permease [Actinophytocola sp.]